MPESYESIEDRISIACDAYRSREKLNVKALSREFDVPYQRPLSRIKGRGSRMARPATHKTLDDAQKQALIQWITLLDNSGTPPTAAMVQQCANQILDRNGANRPVGKNWIYRFINRLPPHLKLIIQKPKGDKPMMAEQLIWNTPRTGNASCARAGSSEICGDTPPPPRSTTNSPPTTVRKLRLSINKAKEALHDLDTIAPQLSKRLGHIFEGSLIQAELNAQCQIDIQQLLREKYRREA